MKLSSNVLQPKRTFFLSDPNMEQSGIIESKRLIYLFFDTNDLINDREGLISNGEIIIGKAIQINLALVEGGRRNIDIMPWIRGSNNSTYMAMNVYTYSTRFETSIRNINSAEFVLENSIASSSTNDYEFKKCMSNGITLYSKEFREDPVKKEILSDTTGLSPEIPEPIYYTLRQQEAECGDVYSLASLSTVITHLGFELIDDNTQISILDKCLMDTFNVKIRDRMKEIRYLLNTSSLEDINMYDTTQLSNEMMFNVIESLQSGYIYQYDSQLGRGINTTNKSFLPFSKFRIKDEMKSNLERSIDTVETHAKDLEKRFGSIRLMFTPSYRGDKIDVYFKDYAPDHQPVIKNVTNIDSGNKIDDEITERLIDCDTDEMNNFDDNEYNTYEY